MESVSEWERVSKSTYKDERFAHESWHMAPLLPAIPSRLCVCVCVYLPSIHLLSTYLIRISIKVFSCFSLTAYCWCWWIFNILAIFTFKKMCWQWQKTILTKGVINLCCVENSCEITRVCKVIKFKWRIKKTFLHRPTPVFVQTSFSIIHNELKGKKNFSIFHSLKKSFSKFFAFHHKKKERSEKMKWKSFFFSLLDENYKSVMLGE
jgi:hypothetical protein